MEEKQSLKTIFGKKNTFFGKIETKEDALKVIKEASTAFMVLGGLEIVVGLLISIDAVVDGAIYLTLAILLRKYHSRAVAVILLLLASLSMTATFLTKAGVIDGIGSNIFLAIVVFAIAIRTVYATFKLKSLSAL